MYSNNVPGTTRMVVFPVEVLKVAAGFSLCAVEKVWKLPTVWHLQGTLSENQTDD